MNFYESFFRDHTRSHVEQDFKGHRDTLTRRRFLNFYSKFVNVLLKETLKCKKKNNRIQEVNLLRDRGLSLNCFIESIIPKLCNF